MGKIREYIFLRDGFRCQYPGCDVRGPDKLELAHRIANTESNYKWIKALIQERYKTDISMSKAKDILNQAGNLKASCRIHNDYFNIGYKREEAQVLVKKLWEDYNNDSTSIFHNVMVINRDDDLQYL